MHLGKTSLTVALYNHPSMPASVKAGNFAEDKTLSMTRFTVDQWLMSHLSLQEVMQVIADLPVVDFCNASENIHCYLLSQFNQGKLSINEILKVYHDKGCAKFKNLPAWNKYYSDFDNIIRIGLERHHELSSDEQAQFRVLLDALLEQYKQVPPCLKVWREFTIALTLIRLAKGERLTEKDCELFFTGDLQIKDVENQMREDRYSEARFLTEDDHRRLFNSDLQTTMEIVNRYGKNVPGAKELFKAIKCHGFVDLSSFKPEEVVELGKLKSQLPPNVFMRLVNSSFQHEAARGSELLYDLVMTKPTVQESKRSDAVSDEKHPLSQRLATALIQFPQLIGHLNAEHAAVIFEQARAESSDKVRQLIEGNNPDHFPLMRSYILDVIGVKAEAQKQYEGNTEFAPLIMALRKDGHKEAVATLLTKIPQILKQIQLELAGVDPLQAQLNRGRSPITQSSPTRAIPAVATESVVTSTESSLVARI